MNGKIEVAMFIVARSEGWFDMLPPQNIYYQIILYITCEGFSFFTYIPSESYAVL